MNREELAWAAGLFDGEGCTTSSRREQRKTRIICSIAQCHREVLDRFRDAVGVGKVYGPYGPYKRGWSRVWKWQTYKTVDAKYVVATLKPWLGSVKRKQFDRVLQEVEQ